MKQIGGVSKTLENITFKFNQGQNYHLVIT